MVALRVGVGCWGMKPALVDIWDGRWSDNSFSNRNEVEVEPSWYGLEGSV